MSSAAARFLVFLLWVVKMSGLEEEEDLEGRERAVEEVEVGFDWARRVDSWVVKARVLDEEISLVLEVLLRGMPYRAESAAILVGLLVKLA